MSQSERQVVAALVTLVLLQIIMLSALYAGIRPHPPEITPLAGIAPLLGAAISLAVSAVILQPLHTPAGRVLSVLAAVVALISFGPQKYFDPQFSLIWPAVTLGQIAAVVIFAHVAAAVRADMRRGIIAKAGAGQA